MIIRLMSLIFILSSVPVYAAEQTDQRATISNPRIFNEDIVTAREEANAAALGQMAEDKGISKDDMRVKILTDLILLQPSRRKNAVAEHFDSIHEKVNEIIDKNLDPHPSRIELWKRTKHFLEEASNPNLWNVSEEDRDEVLRYSEMSDAELHQEIEKTFSFARYSLKDMDWHLFSTDFSGNCIGSIYLFEGIIRDYEERLKQHGDNLKLRELIRMNQQYRGQALKNLRIFREWVYRHWNGSFRFPSNQIFERRDARVSAGSLGHAAQQTKFGGIAENYKSIYEKVKSHLSQTPQRADLRAQWVFTQEFFEEAEDPSRWLENKSPEEAAEINRYGRMTNEELEKEFAKYYRFSTYSLRTLDWQQFRSDTVGNFMDGIFVSRKTLADPEPDNELANILKERLIAGTIFREWVYRHWDGNPRQPSWQFWEPDSVQVSAKSLGVMPKVRGARVAENYKSIYRKAKIAASRESKQERVLMWQSAVKFLEEAANPAKWNFKSPEERAEAHRYSKMTPRELEDALVELHSFYHYRLTQINWDWFRKDAFYELLYVHFLLIESNKKNHRAYKHTDWYLKGEKIYHLYREWVYRHWDDKRKFASFTQFQSADDEPAHAASLGSDQLPALNRERQALVFQLSGTPNQDLLNRTVEIVRANANKSIIFVVPSHAASKPLLAALKAHGVSGQQLEQISFEINSLRTRTDITRFTNYLGVLQAKFPTNNDIAVVADFQILSALGMKNAILLARDKAGQGNNHEPVSLTEIRNVDREGADSVLFNLGWNILSASNASHFRDQIDKDPSTGVFLIRMDALSNFIEHWLHERENAKQLLSAA